MRGLETGDWGQRTGDRGQHRGQGTGDRGLGTGDWTVDWGQHSTNEGYRGELQTALGRCDQLHGHHLLIHGGYPSPSSMAPCLGDTPYSLLLDGGKILQGQPMWFQSCHYLQHTNAVLANFGLKNDGHMCRSVATTSNFDGEDFPEDLRRFLSY